MPRPVSILVCLICLVAAAQAGVAQSADVNGSVLYRQGASLQPAVNWTVTLGDRVTAVDVKGRFRIVNMPPGDYVLKVWRQRVMVRQQNVHIPSGRIQLPAIIFDNARRDSARRR